MTKSVGTILADLPGFPAEDFAAYGDVEEADLSRIQQISGHYLARNWVAIPHVTHHDVADVTEVEKKRSDYNSEAHSVKISLPAILVKVLVSALKAHPKFNASLDPSGAKVIFKKYFNIGVAVDTSGGLLVPVIRACDTKSIAEISAEITEFAQKARGRGLPYEDMRGGCITLSAIGAFGGTAFTPIINAPEVAILGTTKLQWKPEPGDDGKVVWRRVLPLSLSYDHRLINGTDAAKFVTSLAAGLTQASELFSS